MCTPQDCQVELGATGSSSNKVCDADCQYWFYHNDPGFPSQQGLGIPLLRRHFKFALLATDIRENCYSLLNKSNRPLLGSTLEPSRPTAVRSTCFMTLQTVVNCIPHMNMFIVTSDWNARPGD